MIETTDEAVTYLEMVARRESGDLAEAALIVTRTLRQSTQALADHATASGVREGDGAGVSDARTGLRIMAECIERGLAMIGKEETEMLVKRQDAEDIRTVLVALETPLPTGPLSDEALRRLAEGWQDAIECRYARYAAQPPGIMDLLLEYGRRVATEAARLERERIEGECPACRDRESKLRGAERFRADVEAGKVMLLRRIKGGE